MLAGAGRCAGCGRTFCVVAMAWDDSDREAARDRLVEVAGALPDVEVEDSYGHTGFRLRGTRFAWLLVDHHGDGRLALWVRAPKGEQQSLVAADPARYFVPPYVGAQGWVGVLVDPGSEPDWDEIAVLVQQAWRMGATKRALSAYDEARAAEGARPGAP